MRHVYRRWQEITRRVGEGTVFLFVDYDGTLSPIAARPEAAVLPRRTRGLLKRLAGSPRCRLAVISGRSVADVRRRVGIRGVVYAGNHGFEIEGPQIKFKKPLAPAFIKTMKHLKLELRSRLASLRGARVEDKGFSLSVHYRQVEKRLVPVLKAAFRESTRALCAKSAVEIRGGRWYLRCCRRLTGEKGRSFCGCSHGTPPAGRIGGSCPYTSATIPATRTPSRLFGKKGSPYPSEGRMIRPPSISSMTRGRPRGS